MTCRGMHTRTWVRAAIAMMMLDGLTRPPAGAGHATGSALNAAGVGTVMIGWVLAAIGFAIGVGVAVASAGGTAIEHLAGQQALSFILALTGLGTVLAGVLFIIWGIARVTWVRLAHLRAALQVLRPPSTERQQQFNGIRMGSPYGTAVTSASPPAPNLTARLATIAWSPMLLVGFALLSFGAAAGPGAVFTQSEAGTGLSAAWWQRSLFSGDAALLAAVTLLLSTVAAAVRSGDAELQAALNVTITTLEPSWHARTALGLGAIGLLAMAGPFPDLGTGLLLSAVALTLTAIADSYGFEFVRILEIINTGR